MWNELSMTDRAKYIQLGVQSGITDLNTIRNVYNTYAEGEELKLSPYSAKRMTDTLYESAKREEKLGDPAHKYDFTYSEEWADAHGYYPDERGHRDDRVKKPAHPTHPSKGKWRSLNEFQLTELGMEDPNYIMFGMADGGQDPQAVRTYNGSIVLPEITVTPKGNYIHNSYDNLNLYYAGGGFLDTIKSFFGIGENNSKPKEDSSRFKRVRQNDSPTSRESTIVEDDIAKRQKALLKVASNNGAPSSEEYYIPYTGEELRIPGVGRVSSNTLDSIAVNARRAGLSLGDALGLASIETKFGASPNVSTDAFKNNFKKTQGRNPTKEEVKKFERKTMNASYMRNYGGIYPQYLVNNHEWFNRGWEKSPKYKEKLEGIASPLQHAFTQFKLGIYNTGDKGHTAKVKNEGQRLLKLPVIKQWQSEYNRRNKK